MDPKTKISWSRISWSRILSFPPRERSERVGLSACVKHGHVVQSTNCYWLVQSVESYLMEDDLWWKMTSVGGGPLWMTTFDGRFLQNDGFGPSFWGRLPLWGRLNVWCRIHSCGRWPPWKTTFDGRQPLMEDDLGWLAWLLLAFVLSCSFKIMPSVCLYVRRPLMEDGLWWRTTFDGRQPLMEDDLWWKMTNYL